MDTTLLIPNEVIHNFPPFFRLYKDGHVERYRAIDFVPPSDAPNTTTTVRSKDVLISPETKASARLYLPKTTKNSSQKLPLLIYIHGGGFCIQSAFSATYHNYLTSLVEAANVIAVSVDYRLAPEHPLPACYDDSWSAMNWVALHAKDGQGTEPWLNDHADFGRVFLAGNSAGANIAHTTLIRVGADGPGFGLKIVGMVLVHPYFGKDKPDNLWMFICPESSGVDDPRLNPSADPVLLAKLPCKKVLVCTAGKDFLRERGWNYYEALKSSGWEGVVEIMEIEGQDHGFHLFYPTCENAFILMKRISSFINQEQEVPNSLLGCTLLNKAA